MNQICIVINRVNKYSVISLVNVYKIKRKVQYLIEHDIKNNINFYIK